MSDGIIFPGTVCSGTLRSEDLIDAFSDELERICEGGSDRGVDNLQARCVKLYYKILDKPNWQDKPKLVQKVQFAIEDLITELNHFAPDGMYFGTHEGDGSDYGWWHTGDAND